MFPRNFPRYAWKPQKLGDLNNYFVGLARDKVVVTVPLIAAQSDDLARECPRIPTGISHTFCPFSRELATTLESLEVADRSIVPRQSDGDLCR